MKHEHRLCVDEGELDTLLHPARVYEYPCDVVNDPDLSLNEKRAVLASWASDACAIEAAPSLRRGPSGRVVQFDDIMEALRLLDRQVRAAPARPHHATSRRAKFGPGHGDQGAPLH